MISPSRSLLFLLPLLLLSCGKENNRKENNERSNAPAAAARTESATGATAGMTGRVALIDPKRGETEAIEFAGEKITITFPNMGEGPLVGEMRGSGKRAYLSHGDLIAEVKQNDDDGFKLKGPDGALLWKVKLTDEKIKVSNNEENLHPYVLRMEDDLVKVKDDEKEIGRVRFRQDSLVAVLQDGSGVASRNVKGSARSGAYGVLLMERVPYAERLIIMAELLARGR